MRHPSPRHLSGALLGALAVMSLQGCKRIDMVTDWTPASPSPTAYLEDSVLASRVRAALILSPVVNSFNIGVESHRDFAVKNRRWRNLGGMAADPTQIDLAVFVAQTVPGVSSVDSFMFSTGMPAVHATEDKGYSPDPAALQGKSPLGSFPHPEPTGMEKGRSSALSTPAPLALASLSHPLASEGGPTTDTAPAQSRWVSLAHRVLGIRSIQEELLIKQ